MWCTKFFGSYMFWLSQKCKLLKAHAKEWNKKKFGNIFQQVHEVNLMLDDIQDKLIVEPNNERLHKKNKIGC